MEYWLIYDLASGAVLVRGSGPAGSAALQVPPENAALVVVPLAVVASPVLDLDALRTSLIETIDTEAELISHRFITPGTSRAMIYMRKEAEARAWLADDSAPTPILVAEAVARGMTIAMLANEVVALADAWVAVGALIEGTRMGAKSAVMNAVMLGEIIAAGQVDWSAIEALAP